MQKQGGAESVKNTDVLSWDQYFIGIAHLSAMRSKDPSTRVGACLVNSDKRVVGIGYNGLPAGCSDDIFPWEREGDPIETKYPYVVHAELNAILNSTTSLKDCNLYVTMFPCNECAKAIIQSGIQRVYYESDKYAHTDMVKASKKMFEAAGVEFVQMTEAIILTVETQPIAGENGDNPVAPKQYNQ